MEIDGNVKKERKKERKKRKKKEMWEKENENKRKIMQSVNLKEEKESIQIRGLNPRWERNTLAF